MGLISRQYTAYWSALAQWMHRISLRGIVVVIGVLLSLVPFKLALYSPLDASVLRGLNIFEPLRSDTADIAIIAVPDNIVAEWQSDFYSADGLSSLLSNILHSSNASIGLVLDAPLNTELSALDQHIAESEATALDMLHILQKKRYLVEMLEDPRVTLGVSHVFFVQSTTLPSMVNSGLAQQFPNVLLEYVHTCAYCFPQFQSSKGLNWYWAPEPQYFGVSVWYPANASNALSFYGAMHLRSAQEGGAAEPDLLASMAVSGAGLLSKASGESVAILPTSPVGTVAPVYSSKTHYQSRKIQLSFEEALSVSAFPSMVIIGAATQRAQLFEAADIIYSLNKKRYLHAPWWDEFALRLVLIFLTLYLAFLHIRIRRIRTAAAVLLGLALVMYSGALYAAWSKQLWLPISLVYLWGALSVVLLSLWKANKLKQSARRAHRDNTLVETSYLLEEELHYRDAITLLAHHSHNPTNTARICQLGEKLAHQEGGLDKAITVLSTALDFTGGDPRLESQLSTLRRERSRKAQSKSSGQTLQGRAYDVPNTLGRYEVKRELGRGAVGVVYLGFDPAISRQVAIKTLDSRQFSSGQVENLKSRFFREAEAAGRLSHPNIVSIYDVGEQDNLAYIAMDYVDGAPLNEFVQADKLLPVAEVYRIVFEVALALEYAHNNQIIHRDIKPGNIMYGAMPFLVKVADFGIARLLDNSNTSTGEILGSPLYMAPEQLRGSKVGVEADIFSLGVTFYQLLSGAVPFTADNLAGLTYEIIHSRHKNIRSVRKDLPASATRIVNQCLQKRASDRYESAQELASVLKKAIKRDFPNEAKLYGLV